VSLSIAALPASAGIAAGAAQAGSGYTFTRLTSTGGAGRAVGQLTDEGSPHRDNPAHLSFLHVGPASASTAGISFARATMRGQGLGAATSGGVAFGPGGGILPAGNPIDFNVDASFLASAPRQPNGVGPGELVTIRFELLYGQSAHDPFTSLALGLANPGFDMADGLRVGLHVQGYAGGQSESFV